MAIAVRKVFSTCIFWACMFVAFGVVTRGLEQLLNQNAYTNPSFICVHNNTNDNGYIHSSSKCTLNQGQSSCAVVKIDRNYTPVNGMTENGCHATDQGTSGHCSFLYISGANQTSSVGVKVSAEHEPAVRSPSTVPLAHALALIVVFWLRRRLKELADLDEGVEQLLDVIEEYEAIVRRLVTKTTKTKERPGHGSLVESRVHRGARRGRSSPVDATMTGT